MDKNEKTIQKQIDNRIFSHAYLFVGSINSNKQMLAEKLIASILNTKNYKYHHDFINFDVTEQEGIDGIRFLINRLSVKPVSGQYKVALVSHFEQANKVASNAFLKTLEEPSESTIIILMSESRALLPTIISRCQLFDFNSSGLDNAHETNPETIKLLDELDQIYISPISSRINAIHKLAEIDLNELQNLLNAHVHRLKIQLSKTPSLHSQISKTIEAILKLNGSNNKKMVLQHMLLS